MPVAVLPEVELAPAALAAAGAGSAWTRGWARAAPEAG